MGMVPQTIQLDMIKPIEKRIIQKEINPYPYQNLYFTQIDYQPLQPVFFKNNQDNLDEKFKKIKPDILLVSGIANPRIFKKYVRGISSKIKEMYFPDHYYFKKKDIKMESL